MNVKFRPLLTTSINHTYYAGACSDLQFVASRGTAAQMRSARLLPRVIDGNLRVLFEADAAGSPIRDLAGSALMFGLKLVNPQFDNFTEPLVGDAARLPLFTNSGDAARLSSPQAAVLVAGPFQHSPQLAARPVALRLSDANGTLLSTQTLNADSATAAFDLGGHPEGVYQVDESTAGGGSAHTDVVLSPSLSSIPVWGVLVIRIDADFHAHPPEFAIQLQSRKDQLEYFIVADNFTTAEIAQLSLTDGGFQDEGRAEVHFVRLPPAGWADPVITPTLLGGDANNTVMFQSVEQVTRRERGMRRIQLNRNGDVLVENLPQPGADRPQAHFIVYLSKP
jgi:hypothetical protein